MNRLSIIAFTLCLACCIGSCSKEEPDAATGITINGTQINQILNTLCEITGYPGSLGGGNELSLQAVIVYEDDGWTSFDIALPGIESLSQIAKGMDITDDIVIYKFYSTSGVWVGSKNYEVLDGSVTIDDLTDKGVTLKFSDFKFLRELGDNQDTFTVNGTIFYKIYD